jgi:DNA primase
LRISPRTIEEVRESANIVEVASEFTALRRQGTNYTGLCPYHEEKTPSFSVSSEKNFYYCFGCQKGGDAIKLVMDLKSFSFTEAVSHLAERFGVELKFEGHSPEEARAAEQRTSRRRSAYKALAAATAYYHKYLLKSPAAEDARHYLKKRGLEHSTIEEFRLGYAPPRGRAGFMQAALKVGLDREALEAAGLLSPRGGERFVDRVTFPISDRRGRIVGFGARSLGEAKPKYLNSPETEIFNKRSLLYGFPQVAEAVRREKAALVVEGYTDVLMLYQSGIKNAVATLGTAMTEQHLKTLSSQADRIYLLFDPDEAGRKATERAEEAAELTIAATKLGTFLNVVRLSEDPADWLLEHSANEFADLLNSSTPIHEYSIRLLAEQTRGYDAMTRHRALPKIFGYIQKIRVQAPALEMEAKRLAADALQIKAEDLEILLASHINNTLSTEAQRNQAMTLMDPPRRFRKRQTSGLAEPLQEAGHELLAAILVRPDLAARALREGMEAPDLLERQVVLETGDFGEESQARIFALLVEHAGDPGAVLSDERARPLLDEISALQAAGERLYPSLASLRAAWFRLAALSREKAKILTEDFDEKYRLHTEMKQLSRAAAEANNLALEES